MAAGPARSEGGRARRDPGGGKPGGQAGAGEGGQFALGSLVELLGRRHSLELFWALRATPLPFRTLVQRVDAAPPRLSQRLTELREAGIVEVDEAGGYRLTAEGRRLLGVLEPVADWAARWCELSPRQRVPRGSATKARDEP